MKKISIVLLAALAMISCGNSRNYSVQDIRLNNETDSINYIVGFLIGSDAKSSIFAKDSNEVAFRQFVDLIEDAYNGIEEEVSEMQKAGRQIGAQLKIFEQEGLNKNPSWPINETILLQGMVNGLYQDSTMMSGEDAYGYIMACYYQDLSLTEAPEPIFAASPKEAKTIELASHLDSVNYAFGVMAGDQLRKSIDRMGEDVDSSIEEFLESLDCTLKAELLTTQMTEAAQQIGSMLGEQEVQGGLVGFSGLEVKFHIIRQGLVNGLHEYQDLISQDDAGAYINDAYNRQREAQMRTLQEENNSAKAEGEAFLAENAKREGVKVTESGLQYEVLVEGNGPKPTAASTVRVHYEGTLIDGTVFDSSYDRGESISFPLNGVIKGWTEGLQLMSVGSKYKFFIPYQLAYGEHGAGGSIPAYAALIFTVELLGIE